MRTMTIGRQLVLLVTGFTVAMAAGMSVLSYVIHHNAAITRRLTEQGNRQSEALFGLVQSVSKVQGTAQQLVRSKDPDVMEDLLRRGEALAQDAVERIRGTGVGNNLASAFEAMQQANAKSIQSLLHGEAAPAGPRPPGVRPPNTHRQAPRPRRPEPRRSP